MVLMHFHVSVESGIVVLNSLSSLLSLLGGLSGSRETP